jgi:hypothetical protein
VKGTLLFGLSSRLQKNGTVEPSHDQSLVMMKGKKC